MLRGNGCVDGYGCDERSGLKVGMARGCVMS